MRDNLKTLCSRTFHWKRLAVEPEHFGEHNIIPLAAKRDDTRCQKFVQQYGPKCAEVEAIPADALRDMVKDAIESHIPDGEWQRLKKIEDQERRSWKDVMGRFAAGGQS
jgi:hypothetical protein